MNAGISASIAPPAPEPYPPPALRVAGLVPLTTVDLPGRLAAVLFCQGCPWTCGYCQNPHLIPAAADTVIGWNDIRDFLERRRGLLDGVVISGGEPTHQHGLAEAVGQIRDLGFAVGLHTGGAYPEKLRRILPALDWVGLDIKTDPAGYPGLTGAANSGDRAQDSLQQVICSGVDYEVRTTVHPQLFDRERLWQLACRLAQLGVRSYALQAFRTEGCVNEQYLHTADTPPVDADLLARIGALFPQFAARGFDAPS